MVISELVRHIRTTLESADIESFEFETRCIVEDIMKADYITAVVNTDECPPYIVEKVNKLVEKRINGEPLQYLLGQWEFYGYPFKVGKGVLIPRPDTETLIETVLKHFQQTSKKNVESPSIVDLCSGSGCIAITLNKQLPESKVYAVELSSDAMPYLVENIRLNNAKVTILKGDICDEKMLENFCDENSPLDFNEVDCIVSNPPYLTDDEMKDLQTEVTKEPVMALAGGNNGLKFYNIITCLWTHILKKGGLLAFEIGYMQGQQVKDILSKNGFNDIKVIKDLGGNDRVVCGIKA